jgi:zinc carboxypeptidase
MRSSPARGSSRARIGIVVAVATAVASIAAIGAAPAASAATSRTVSAAAATATACPTTPGASARSSDRYRVAAPTRGLVRVRLSAAGGDWDLGVFGAKGRRVAGAATFGARELAEGFVRKGERLTVQACRIAGDSASASTSVSFVAIKAGKARKLQIVDVRTASRKAKARLQGLGLDLTERGDANSISVLLHGAADARKLRTAGFTYTVRVADVAKQTRADQRADARYARSAGRRGSDLPSGNAEYRHLADYEYELKKLAWRYPSLVKPIVLPHKTVEGRDVVGIEITTDPWNVQDGKPTFLNVGAHHAREWPSAEHALEWAYDLLTNYGRDRHVRDLVRSTRNIVIPIVNPDGFNISREAAPLGDFSLFDYEMKRKNCRISVNTPPEYQGGTCDDNPAGVARGTDLNRNYGGQWGGSGASPTWSIETYRGDGPFSEPETQNVHELAQSRQITNLITNHTFADLVLRPPGVAEMGFPLEEPQLKALGARMTAHNGYANNPSFGLYDTTGATEDWTFWTGGGVGYTFEIGTIGFHPPFAQGVVDEYLGRGDAAGAGKGGNRAAYYEMLDATADQSLHGTLTGTAPRGWRLQIRKDFLTSTSPVWNDDFGTDIGEALQFPDYLVSDLKSKGGTFSWSVNPSTRPIAAGRDGRDPTGPPQDPIALANPDGIPAENVAYPEQPYESIPFTVKGPADGVDNGRFTVHVEWGNPQTDWDVYVVNAAGEIVTQSASFGDTTEDATLFDPPPGDYVVHIVNFDQVQDPPDDWTNGSVTFESPRPRVVNPKEAWSLTCFDQKGSAVSNRSVVVDRGQTVDLGNACAKAK